MLKVFRLFIIAILVCIAFLPVDSIQASPKTASNMDARTQAEQLLNQMTPEERVGQLFLVTFQGTDISPTSQIYDLVVSRHIGGVVLRSENNNVIPQDNILQSIISLNTGLQSVNYETSHIGVVDPQTGKNFKPQYVPLFIGISQEGNGYPTDQILSGVTTLPSQMTIGATWQTDLALQVGTVAGSELSTAGFNLLLGPSLDVLDTPRTEGGLDLGIRAFGGDPFWVGEMAGAYISGVHAGSQNRIMVVAKHFPGYGSSDRLPGEEVATVRKSLEQLKQIELAPFLAVCGDLSDPDHITDALLVSHIRFQGFQGNIRATTRPVSFDATALTQLIGLPVIAEWRDQGGLLVSDDLGSRAVRRFYDPAEKVFDARQVTRNAFLAGNDVLYMGNMRSNTDPDSYTSIIHTLDSFTQKYYEDPTFAARVDASALNILTRKFKLYPSFNLVSVTSSSLSLDEVGQAGQVTFDVLRQGSTLISPDEQNLAINLPNPPALNEDLVFFTSTLTGKQCTTCPELPVFAVDDLQKAVLKNYGPPNASQVRSEMLSSYTFKELTAYLANAVSPEFLESDLTQADWLVFAVLDVSGASPETEALKKLLTDHYDLVRNKKIIVFAFSAPYYYDATDISKITAYYGLYSKVPAALDIAARILYHEITPEGASPVSITGTGYDLIQVTAPDPNQIIPLELDTPVELQLTPALTPQPTDIPLFSVGDKLPLKAGVILDQNGNPVPDGTTVKFIINRTIETTTSQQIDSVTSDGMAKIQFTIDSKGLYEIKVISEPALASQILQLNVTSDSGAFVTAIEPTPIMQSTPGNGNEGEIVQTQSAGEKDGSRFPAFGVWLAALLLLLSEVAGSYYLLTRSVRYSGWAVRTGMLMLITGWLAYLYMALGLPGSDGLTGLSILLITMIGGGLGLIGMLVWRGWLIYKHPAD
jgi:beta-N-acetylhexosaminidase